MDMSLPSPSSTSGVAAAAAAGALSEDAARNEFLHDLVGAPIDGLHLGVHVGSANGVLCHVATPAEELHTRCCNTVLQVGQPVCVWTKIRLVSVGGCCTLMCI